MKIRRSQRNDTIVHVNASIQIAFFCLKAHSSSVNSSSTFTRKVLLKAHEASDFSGRGETISQVQFLSRPIIRGCQMCRTVFRAHSRQCSSTGMSAPSSSAYKWRMRVRVRPKRIDPNATTCLASPSVAMNQRRPGSELMVPPNFSQITEFVVVFSQQPEEFPVPCRIISCLNSSNSIIAPCIS